MEVTLKFDLSTEDRDDHDDVMSALNGYKFRGALWEILHNKRKEIVERQFEDKGLDAQAEGAQAVFDAIWDELDSWGVADLIKN